MEVILGGERYTVEDCTVSCVQSPSPPPMKMINRLKDQLLKLQLINCLTYIFILSTQTHTNAYTQMCVCIKINGKEHNHKDSSQISKFCLFFCCCWNVSYRVSASFHSLFFHAAERSGLGGGFWRACRRCVDASRFLFVGENKTCPPLVLPPWCLPLLVRQRHAYSRRRSVGINPIHRLWAVAGGWGLTGRPCDTFS